MGKYIEHVLRLIGGTFKPGDAPRDRGRKDLGDDTELLDAYSRAVISVVEKVAPSV